MIKRFFSFLLFFVLAQPLFAEEVTLQSLLDKAIQNNPQVIAAKERYEASKARIPQASSLDDPRFEFRYDKMTASMDAVMEGKTAPMRVFGVSQEIPFPTKLLFRAQIAAKESQMMYAEYQEKEKEIVSMVKSLYAQLAFIYKSLEIIKENKTLLDQLSKTTATRYSVGKESQQDALKAQVEIAKMDNELVMLEQRRQVIQAKINILLDQDPSLELGEFKLPEFSYFKLSLPELNKLAIANRQELKGFRLAVERAYKTVSLAKQEYLPDFMVKYERMERDNRLTDWAGMVGVTLPLWFWQKQDFNVKEMKHEALAMKALYKDKENEVLLEVKEYFSEVLAHQKLIELYKTAYLPQAEQALKSSMTGYEADQVDFLNLLDGQRMLLEFKLDSYRALIDYEVALAGLERSVGKDMGQEI
jgi:outer membrane protein TolC